MPPRKRKPAPEPEELQAEDTTIVGVGLVDKIDTSGWVLDPVTNVLAPPKPWAAGTYAMYDDGKGGFVLVATIDRDGQPAETIRRHVPGTLVRLLRGGRGAGLVKKLMGDNA